MLKIKLLCKESGIERLDAGNKGIVISFFNNQFAKPEALIAYMSQRASHMKVRPDQRLVIRGDWNDLQGRLHGVDHSIRELSKLVSQ